MKNIKVRKKRAPKHDFKDGQGRVFAHKHDNGKGWVADSAKVEETVYVGRQAEIFNRAIVKGTTRLEGKSRISGSAVVSGAVILRQNAHIYGTAVVRDKSVVGDTARIFGDAHVAGTSNIFGDSIVTGSAQLFAVTLNGPCRISGDALIVRSIIGSNSDTVFVEIKGNCSVINSNVSGNVLLDKHSQVIRSTMRCGSSTMKILVTDFAIVADASNIFYGVTIKDHAVLIRSTISGHFNYDNVDETVQITGRTVLQHQTFNRRADLHNYINLLTQNGARLGAQIAPNGQIANFTARGLPPIDQPAAGRRIMRLQEADA